MGANLNYKSFVTFVYLPFTVTFALRWGFYPNGEVVLSRSASSKDGHASYIIDVHTSPLSRQQLQLLANHHELFLVVLL